MIEPEPLKGKTEFVDDYELRVEEDCHPATITAVFTADDVKAAVEYYKKRFSELLKKTETEGVTEEEWFALIDESFPDIVQKKKTHEVQN